MKSCAAGSSRSPVTHGTGLDVVTAYNPITPSGRLYTTWYAVSRPFFGCPSICPWCKLALMRTDFGWTRRKMLASLAGGALAAHLRRLFALPSGNPVRFVDVARQAGIRFIHENAASSEKYLIETMGSGCAWIDYDQNGLFDLY